MRFIALLRCVTSVAALVIAAGALAEALPTARPEEVGMSAQRLRRVSEAVKQEVDEGSLPGAVVMVARKGKLAYADAIGFLDKTAGTPMSRDAIFRIYSMTKPIVSVGLMQLVEEGRVQLTDPV